MNDKSSVNDKVTTGQAIRQAYQFLRQVHKDAQSVLETIDALMIRSNWLPPANGRVSYGLGNRMEAQRWLLRSLVRIYSNSTVSALAATNVAVHITFEPPPIYSEPVCLCIAANFPSPMVAQTLWDTWEHDASERILEHLQGTRTPQPLPSALIKGAFPSAQSGSAFVINLCDLTAEPVVKAAVVDPLLSVAVAEGNKVR